MAKRYVPAYVPMLTDRQWSILAPLFPDPPVSPHGGQQPIANRHCFEGILWMLAPDGAEYVVPGNHRQTALQPGGWVNCNLRTQFLKIIRRAGLTPWPRLFHNLRAS